MQNRRVIGVDSEQKKNKWHEYASERASRCIALVTGRTDELLRLVFGDLGHRLKPSDRMSLKDLASCIQYLHRLYHFGVPSSLKNGTVEQVHRALVNDAVNRPPVHGVTDMPGVEVLVKSRDRQREALKVIADSLWMDAVETEEFDQCGKWQAQKLLEYASKRFPGNPVVEDAREFLNTHDIPAPAPTPTNDKINLDIFHPPERVSKHSSGNLGLPAQNDLSERIYAMSLVLDRCGEKSVPKTIAEALNRATISRRVEEGNDNGWADHHVRGRIKDHKDKLRAAILDQARKAHKLPKKGRMRERFLEARLLERENSLIYLWVSRYYMTVFILGIEHGMQNDPHPLEAEDAKFQIQQYESTLISLLRSARFTLICEETSHK